MIKNKAGSHTNISHHLKKEASIGNYQVTKDAVCNAKERLVEK
jgi:hypothetical protein